MSFRPHESKESRLSGHLPQVDALLALDVGNSRIGMALWDDDGLHAAHRLESAETSNWATVLHDLWNQTGGARARAIAMASVSPKTARQLADTVFEVCGVEPYRIGEDIPLPIAVDLEAPEEVGVDRVCAAAAAYERIQGACAVASFGTATTIDCVSEDGRFLGGAILPGIEMCFEALHVGTAQLPRVQSATPSGAYGRSTHDAIVNGVVYGAVGALRELVERYAGELREWPQLVITGGNAPLINSFAEFVDAVVPDLCLMGVALAYRKATGQP